MVKIRLKRFGRKNHPFWRINAVDSRAPRDGKVIEELGFYDPISKDTAKQVIVDKVRVEHWLKIGAQPSATVKQLLKRALIPERFSPPKRPRPEGPMRLDILTLFPEMFAGVLGSSILKRAQEKNLVSYHLHQLRDFTRDPHRKVDDRPFGGGPGMVLMCQPVIDAVNAIESMDARPTTRVILAPTGQPFKQAVAAEMSLLPRVLLIAGHYEGFDERIHEILAPREISIGDFILSGGELPAMVVVDALVRLIPGVLGDEMSHHGESFGEQDPVVAGGLEYPHYTRPREFQGRMVPEVLISGNHGAVEIWRRQQAQKRTAERRPDLTEKRAD